MTAVGSIMYVVMGTHIDVVFAVQHLIQFSSNPGQAHWTATQRVVRYLYATQGHILTLGGSGKIVLHIFMDSDWSADVDNHQSISGYVFSLGGGAISWSSKKQAMVATSSTEAEYMASCHAMKEAMWLCALLKLIGFEQKQPTLISCDNNSLNTLGQDPSFHKRMKHIDIQYHYVYE